MLHLSRAENIWNGCVARAIMICDKNTAMSLPCGMDSGIVTANMIYGVWLCPCCQRRQDGLKGEHQEWTCPRWLCHFYAVEDMETDLMQSVLDVAMSLQCGLKQVHLISSFVQDRALSSPQLIYPWYPRAPRVRFSTFTMPNENSLSQTGRRQRVDALHLGPRKKAYISFIF